MFFFSNFKSMLRNFKSLSLKLWNKMDAEFLSSTLNSEPYDVNTKCFTQTRVSSINIKIVLNVCNS